MVVVDSSGIICFANETVAQVLGYAPRDLVGCPIDTLIPERLRGRHAGHLAEYQRAPRNREMGVSIADLTARRVDGSEFPAGIRLAPFSVGGERYVAAAIRDMTERRRINEALVSARGGGSRQSREEPLPRDGESRSAPADADHSASERVDSQVWCGNRKLPVCCSGKDRQSRAMARLLNALLDISRLESGAIEPQRTPVRLADVLGDLRVQFDPIVRARGLNLRVSAEDVIVSTDRILLVQLIENLLGNAVKYTDQGGIAVRCSLDNEFLSIHIEDTGIGIPADKIDRIFDEYYQVDSSGTRRSGVGLGLAIAREAARLLGYKVSVKSQVGLGTQVRIDIPRQTIVANPGARPGESMTFSTSTQPSRRARLILVEDNEGVRAATELFLTIEGYEIVTAASAAEAGQIFAALRGNEILIADYHLDGENTGLQLLAALRERSGVKVPAIVLSGDLPAVLRVVKTPIVNCKFLSKPVDTNALLEAINELTPVLRG